MIGPEVSQVDDQTYLFNKRFLLSELQKKRIKSINSDVCPILIYRDSGYLIRNVSSFFPSFLSNPP
jgi:hypothetical protein